MMSKGRNSLTIDDRVNIIERLELGEMPTKLAIEYGITPSAISRIKKKKETIFDQKRVLEQCGSSTKRKRWTGIETTPREQSLFTWMSQKRDIGDSVTGPILSEQALIFHQSMNGSPGFKASSGYLSKFKKRHSLRAGSMPREKVSSNTTASDQFCQKISQICQDHGYSLDHIYNADETGLYWKMLPNYTLIKPEERQAKVPKDRVTVMVCTNASGTHRIPLLVVGKSKKLRCSKNQKVLPVQYRGQKSAWMTEQLTLDWYENIFIPAVKEHHGIDQKVLLLIDNAPSHPPIEDFEKISDMCRVMYLPPNVTALLQPMDQGIIEKMKRIYKTNLLRFVLTADSQQGITELLNKITMMDVLNFISYSWRQVLELNIRNAWKKLFPFGSSSTDQLPTAQMSADQDILSWVQCLPDCAEVTTQDAENWLNYDAQDPGWRQLSSTEILNREKDEYHEDEDDESDHEYQGKEPEHEEHVSDQKTLEAMNVVMKFCQTSGDCTAGQMESLQDVRDIIIQTILLSNSPKYRAVGKINEFNAQVKIEDC